MQFTVKLLCVGCQLTTDRLVGALTDVVKLWQYAVVEVGTGDGEQTVTGDECRLTAVHLLAPATQLTQLTLQSTTVSSSQSPFIGNTPVDGKVKV